LAHSDREEKPFLYSLSFLPGAWQFKQKEYILTGEMAKDFY
jgi:hypothetical protein